MTVRLRAAAAAVLVPVALLASALPATAHSVAPGLSRRAMPADASSPTPSASPSSTPTPTPTSSPSATPSATPTPSISPTSTPKPTPKPTPVKKHKAAPRGDVFAARLRTMPARVARLNWHALAMCESGGRPRAVDSSGLYFGMYQFSLGTWHGLGGRGRPDKASKAEQTFRAELLYLRSGRSPWPACGYKLYLGVAGIRHVVVTHKAVHHKVVKHKTVKHKVVKHKAVKHKAVKHKAVKHKTVKHKTVKHKTVKHKAVKHKVVKKKAAKHKVTKKKATVKK